MLHARPQVRTGTLVVLVDPRASPSDFLSTSGTMVYRGTRNWELVWVWHSCVGGPPVLFAKVHQDRKDFISTVHSYRRRVQETGLYPEKR